MLLCMPGSSWSVLKVTQESLVACIIKQLKRGYTIQLAIAKLLSTHTFWKSVTYFHILLTIFSCDPSFFFTPVTPVAHSIFLHATNWKDILCVGSEPLNTEWSSWWSCIFRRNLKMEERFERHSSKTVKLSFVLLQLPSKRASYSIHTQYKQHSFSHLFPKAWILNYGFVRDQVCVYLPDIIQYIHYNR